MELWDPTLAKGIKIFLATSTPLFGHVATNYTVNYQKAAIQLSCSGNGYGMHAGPSPPRRAEASKFDDDVSPRYTHGYQGGGRGGARFREGPPPYGRGRSYGRGYGAPHGKDLINIDGEYVHRNDPNLSPREGDWICQNPNCGNLNFARRTHCNNCNKFRYSAREAYEPRRSPPFRSYPSPPRGPPRMVGPPGDRAPAREMARYRSPPHGWGASDPRAYAGRSPPERAGRFTDPSTKGRMGFRGERDPRDRVKYEWSATDDYVQRERPYDGYLDRSRRRSGSPRGNWGNDLRDRSRSPARNRPMKSSFTGRGRPDDYAADPYGSRGRPNGMEAGRGRGHAYRAGSGPYPGETRGDQRAAPRARNEDGY
ncbi:RNA-binding protein-related [Zea mays]|uniref:RNA-binding protein-related n=1 Tax=Zea mays TaxID=4577 RepID=A0A1D6N6W4_MAIZE|nr:RNA-binding protein-related [Zea mays]